MVQQSAAGVPPKAIGDRTLIIIEMAFAAVWTWVVFTYLPDWVRVPDSSFAEAALTTFLGPGMLMAMMVLTVGLHRFLGNDALEGGRFHGAHAAVNQRVLINSTEQLVLAMAIWPAAALQLGERGPGILAAMGVSFVVARILFWVGYHIRPAMRAFGFAATFYPTVVLGVWGLIRSYTG